MRISTKGIPTSFSVQDSRLFIIEGVRDSECVL